MEMKLEVVVLPVWDVDKAKDFYERLGFQLDVDHVSSDDFRVVQLTPPGSGCSIVIGDGLTLAEPGSAQGLYLIVPDIEAARAPSSSAVVSRSARFSTTQAGCSTTLGR